MTSSHSLTPAPPSKTKGGSLKGKVLVRNSPPALAQPQGSELSLEKLGGSWGSPPSLRLQVQGHRVSVFSPFTFSEALKMSLIESAASCLGVLFPSGLLRITCQDTAEPV